EPGRPARVTESSSELVPAVAIGVSAVGEELIAAVAMQAQPPHRLGDDALQLHRNAPAVDAGWRVETELEGKRRKAERFLIEVVEGAEPKISGLRPIVDLPRVGRK